LEQVRPGRREGNATVSTIDFLVPNAPFSSEILRVRSIGGAGSSVVYLAEALAKRGHDVCVFNGIGAARQEAGVHWRPFAEAANHAGGEIGIAVSNCTVLNGLHFQTPILWLHNPLKSWTHIRRGNVSAMFKARPLFVVLGEYHSAHVPRWFPSGGRRTIHHGIPDEYFRRTPVPVPPPARAIFTSAPYRGLEWLLKIWPGIKNRVPAARFEVFAPKPHQAEANALRSAPEGVLFRECLSPPALLRELRTARVLLAPGHYDETYCLAAAEATACGVPVVTRGIGALRERVRDGITGFLAASEKEFSARTAELLSDDELWCAMHRNCLSTAELASWDKRAEEWERLFAQHTGPGKR
jgi:glycosyltransferase involved in cell wall biosynthesis